MRKEHVLMSKNVLTKYSRARTSMIFKSEKTTWSWSWHKKNKLFPQFSFFMILQVLVLKGDDTLFLELDMC